MAGLLEAFLNPILPIFAVGAMGYVFGRLEIFKAEMASTINQFVILVALPALLFSFLARAPFEDFNWALVGFYFAGSATLYATGYVIIRHLFQIDFREALLLAMATCFSNHVFFVLFIALSLYGEEASLPVLAIIAFDALVMFGGTFIFLDFHARGGGRSLVAARQVFLRNPMIIALTLGMLIGVFGIPVHDGLITYAEFTGGAAAPAALFALGLIVSTVPLRRPDGAENFVLVTKLVVHPALFIGVLLVAGYSVGGVDNVWVLALLLCAAGPIGAMPFVLALKYGVATERLVRVILYSTVLSLFTLSLLANY